MYSERKKNIAFLPDLICLLSKMMLISFIAVFFIHLFGENYIMSGNSMSDIIFNDDHVLIDTFRYKIIQPKRNDIILFLKRNGEKSVKRIIGLPGDTLYIDNQILYINGEKTDYSPITISGLLKNEIHLEKDEYFVLGDNLDFSEDSRSEAIGNIKKENIIGRVWYVIYPTPHMGEIK